MANIVVRIRSGLLAAGILALAAGPAAALEVREGRMKLFLHEDLGRFSLYYLTDLQKGTYLPLFVDSDPRTSSTTLLVENRVSRLGESSEYQQETRRTARGAEFVWSSRTIQVLQSFEFVTSSSSQLADGVRMIVTVKNLGEQASQIGFRILLDTSLGEEGSFHFLLDGQKQLSRETDLTGGSRPAYWSSPRHSDAAGMGLLCLVSGEGLTQPDRIVFANWQRLNESSWTFQASGNRSFSNLPYSINDSAVSMYYGPRSVGPGSTMSVAAVLAAAGNAGFSLGSASGLAAGPKSTPQILSAIASTSGISDPLLAARADLGVLNDLLRSIDARAANAEGLSDQEIASLQEALRELEARVRKYAREQAADPNRP